MRPRICDRRFVMADFGSASVPLGPAAAFERAAIGNRQSRLDDGVAIGFSALSCWAAVSRAQDKTETPLTLGGFDTQGSVTVGYRFDDVKGYRPMFQELSDLNQGFRLMDFNMFGDAAKGPIPLRTATRSRSPGLAASLSRPGSSP